MARGTSANPPNGWTRVDARIWGGREGALWQHVSGWHVEHCGHPTALWPYYLWHDGLPNRIVVSHNGLGFTDIKATRAMVEEISAGALAITTGGCCLGIARIPTRTASGGNVPAREDSYYGLMQGVWSKRGIHKTKGTN
jgi:hypothetical protein